MFHPNYRYTKQYELPVLTTLRENYNPSFLPFPPDNIIITTKQTTTPMPDGGCPPAYTGTFDLYNNYVCEQNFALCPKSQKKCRSMCCTCKDSKKESCCGDPQNKPIYPACP